MTASILKYEWIIRTGVEKRLVSSIGIDYNSEVYQFPINYNEKVKATSKINVVVQLYLVHRIPLGEQQVQYRGLSLGQRLDTHFLQSRQLWIYIAVHFWWRENMEKWENGLWILLGKHARRAKRGRDKHIKKKGTYKDWCQIFVSLKKQIYPCTPNKQITKLN